jgi:hypothetical protein
VAGDVPDRQAEPAVADLDHVVPISADRNLLGGGDVPGGHAQAGQAGQAPRQQASLQRLGDLTLNGEPGPLDRQCDPVRDELQQVHVALPELTLSEHPDVQDPDHLSLDDQRNAEQRPDVLLAHQGVDDGDRRVVEVRDHDRLPRGGDPAGESAANGKPEPSLDLLLEALGRPRRQRPPVVLDQQHRSRVRPEDVGDPLEQLSEEIVQVQVGERRLRDALNVLQPRRRFRRRGLGGDLLLIRWLCGRFAYSVEMLGSA